MKMIYFLLLASLLVACEQPGASGGSQNMDPLKPAAPRLIVFGDDLANAGAGFVSITAASIGVTVINYSRNYDGSNGAMIGGIQNLWPEADIKAGDKVVYMAGIYDSKWYGNSDPANQAKTYLKGFLQQLLAKGVTVYIATVPRLPAIGYTTGAPLANGNDNASDFYSAIIRTVVAEINSQKLVTVEINQQLSQVGSNWNASGTALSTVGNNAAAVLFLNKMQ